MLCLDMTLLCLALLCLAYLNCADLHFAMFGYYFAMHRLSILHSILLDWA